MPQRKLQTVSIKILTAFIGFSIFNGCASKQKIKLPSPEICVFNGQRGRAGCYDKQTKTKRTLNARALTNYICVEPGDFKDLLDSLHGVYSEKSEGK